MVREILLLLLVLFGVLVVGDDVPEPLLNECFAAHCLRARDFALRLDFWALKALKLGGGQRSLLVADALTALQFLHSGILQVKLVGLLRGELASIKNGNQEAPWAHEQVLYQPVPGVEQ